ncbi:hypothetical protein JB92DRAFT_2664593, partial [Gautieria morchelliformis]
YLKPASDAFASPLSLTNKVTRGFKHPQLACLVCPVGWLDEFDNDSRFHPYLLYGKCIPHPHDWPLLLFNEETFDIEDLYTSFLCNEMLVRGWRLIFQGPSAVDGQALHKVTKRGNARINGMMQVTVPGLAYVVMLVC